MIRGVTVQVLRPTEESTHDRFNNVVYGAAVTENVSNVLVSPGATENLEASRPEGVSVAYTLHFPKTYTADLEGCFITLPEPWAGTYAVIGKPTPYIDVDTPTPWHMPCEVAAAHG